MEKDSNGRNSRQYSYSETNLSDIKYISTLNGQDIIIEDLSIPYKKMDSPPLEKNYKQFSKHYIFKRLMLFTMHLALISLFEIIFFFNVIIDYENNSFTNLIDSFANPLVNICQKFNTSDKIVFTNIVNSFINITNINYNAYESLNKRNISNQHILGYAWIYFGFILGISLLTILVNHFNNNRDFFVNNRPNKNKSINLIKIIIDNVIMIILLGLYEYLFFKTIIIKYIPISNNELTKYLIDKIKNCLV